MFGAGQRQNNNQSLIGLLLLNSGKRSLALCAGSRGESSQLRFRALAVPVTSSLLLQLWAQN